MQNIQPYIDSLQKFAQKRLNFEHPPKLFLRQDQENARYVFGKTAYYDPNEKSITLFVTGRHPKDILRSFAHELVHHCQNLRGDLTPEKCGKMGIDYAQKNDHMREMEREAYERGNLCFRDWEDKQKVAMQQENNQLKENKKMVKISKKDLKGLISRIVEARLEKDQVTEEVEEIDEAGCASHKRDEELEEGKGCCGMKGCPGPGKPHSGKYAIKESEELQEKKSKKKGSKPDYLDLDGDGNKKESMKKAAADKKKKKKANESKIQTPEQEQKLYESRFNKRNQEIFDKLKKLWTK